ncbi:MAG: hypothetical protein E5W35_02320 [Mesorhizobium sp.]|nr:MAG: hypothetical protein E5W35_02320 [Mesorhizobium sp.]
MTDAIEPDFEILRRPEPPRPPPYDCVICCRTIEADRWTMQRDFPRYQPPVCEPCQRRWASLTRRRPPRITRGDHRNLLRLSALIQALNWEVINGNGRSPIRTVSAW